MANQLTEQETAWFEELKPLLSDFKENWQHWSVERCRDALGKMCQNAEELHNSLKARGWEPVHSPKMMENRAKDDRDPFYFNLHALEDLVAILSGRSVSPKSKEN